MMPVIVSQSCLKQANWNDEQDHEHDESSDLFPQRKSPENGLYKPFSRPLGFGGGQEIRTLAPR